MKPLPKIAKHYGHFKYKDQTFLSKNQALDSALLHGDFRPNISYIFHDDVYGALDWTQEPSETMDELYQQRARQLRQKYDYIIVLFSGGVDSDNVLHAFSRAGVFIDEIQTFWPLSIVDKLEAIPDVHHELGAFFEYKLAVVPKLEKFHKSSPKTKITVVDTTDHLKQNWNENFLSDELDNFRIVQGLYGTLHHYKIGDIANETAERVGGKSVGVIYGADRVKPFVEDGEVKFSFYDGGTSGWYNVVHNANSSLFTPELFYWSTDLPQIPIKQLHLIKKAMETDDALYDSIVNPEPRSTVLGVPRMRSEFLTNPILYPHWDKAYQKLVKDDNDIILKLIIGDKYQNHTNPVKLRTGTFVTPFVDTIIDLKTQFFFNRYGRIAPDKGFTILKSVDEPGYYNIQMWSRSRPYSAGKLNRKEA